MRRESSIAQSISIAQWRRAMLSPRCDIMQRKHTRGDHAYLVACGPKARGGGLETVPSTAIPNNV